MRSERASCSRRCLGPLASGTPSPTVRSAGVVRQCSAPEVIAMPKRRASRSKKRNPNDVWIPVTAALPFGTPAAEAVSKSTLIGTLLKDLYVISVKGTFTLQNHVAGEDPIFVGFAHDDLTVTEIAEYLDVNHLGPAMDIIARERASRPVRRAGVFSGFTTHEALNQGQPSRTGLGFSIAEGRDLAIYARNGDLAQLTDTATRYLKFAGTVYGRWK